MVQKPLYHTVSLSGGKDSSAMLLLMLERDLPINKVLYADTGMEFPEMQSHILKLDERLFQERGLHIETLKSNKSFEYYMFEQPRRGKDGTITNGYGWPGMRVRWCTGQLKTHLIHKSVKTLNQKYRIIHYIGIAADEQYRCTSDSNNRYPLVQWNLTEQQALHICYSRGYRFGHLYEIYRRASCWCCPFQRIGELKKLRHHHPELWLRLREMDKHARLQFGSGPLGQFRKDWTVEALEKRFSEEDDQFCFLDLYNNISPQFLERKNIK